MKKLILISTICATLASVSAFGQGYFAFTSAKSQAWLGGTVGGGAISTINVSFLWASSSATPEIQALTGMTGTPTATPLLNQVAWASGATNASAWSAILTDPNFTLAVNNNNGIAVGVPVQANG